MSSAFRSRKDGSHYPINKRKRGSVPESGQTSKGWNNRRADLESLYDDTDANKSKQVVFKLDPSKVAMVSEILKKYGGDLEVTGGKYVHLTQPTGMGLDEDVRLSTPQYGDNVFIRVGTTGANLTTENEVYRYLKNLRTAGSILREISRSTNR